MTITYVVDGVAFEFESNYGSEATGVGDRVQVFFNSEDPSEALTSRDRDEGARGHNLWGYVALIGAGWLLWRRLSSRASGDRPLPELGPL